MATQHVVVDGSNIATEGRSLPSLEQLEAAVEELHRELPEAEVTVVVDATFAHRVDAEERVRFEQAALRGEYVYPPAGAIGRGDAFLLRIAERVEGIVLSNDSFQEFHGEHEWLFDRGRLLGATPVPGVGWIFVPRTPVRGQRSRVAVRDASRAKDRVVKAIAEATREVVDPEPEPVADASARRSRSRSSNVSPQAVNDPMTFISFIAEHPLGEAIEGMVESFTSHGAVVRFGEVRCYVPLSGLGSPPPRAAREVLTRGETRSFVVTALDPFRRGVELALPGVAVISGHPSDETVAAEMKMARRAKRDEAAGGASKRMKPAVTSPASQAAADAVHEAIEAATADATPLPRRRGRPRVASAAIAADVPTGPRSGAGRRKSTPGGAADEVASQPRRRRSPEAQPAEPAPRQARKAAPAPPAVAPRKAAAARKAAAPAPTRVGSRVAKKVSASPAVAPETPARRGPGRPRKVVAAPEEVAKKSLATPRKSSRSAAAAPATTTRARNASAAKAPPVPVAPAAPRRSPAKSPAVAASTARPRPATKTTELTASPPARRPRRA
jgi:hypothetical protein